MIIDKLKNLEINNQWDAEHLIKINDEEAIEEIKNQYSSIHPIDYNLYSNIITSVEELFTNTEENDIIGENPFYEKVLLQLLFLESKGLDSLYSKYIVSKCNPAYAVIEFEKLLKNDIEYGILVNEYNRYLTKSLSLLNKKVDTVRALTKEDIKQFGTLINSLKEIANK